MVGRNGRESTVEPGVPMPLFGAIAIEPGHGYGPIALEVGQTARGMRCGKSTILLVRTAT